MSFIVKGIHLPKEYTQVIAITPNGEVWQVNPIGKNERLEAQAIQIPKGHGDIIDREDVFTYCQWDEDALNEVTPLLKSED